MSRRKLGRLQSYGSTPSVYSFALTGLAGNGSITAVTDSVNGDWTYSYDQFNRLLTSSKSTAPAQGFQYGYDRYGNRMQQNITQGTGPTANYAFDSANRISGSLVTYDALGNVIDDGLGNAYTYDAESRLIKVVNNAGTYNYAYDAEGRRVRNATSEFVYDLAGRAVAIFGAVDGVWNYGEIYAGGRHLATYSGGTTNFLHTDWLGTKRVMAGVGGASSQTCASLPFGDGLSCTGPTDWNFNHFTDDIHDSESNLEHTWFRQLSTTQGRWTSPDPALVSMDLSDPQSLNRYAYVGNDPMNFLDPSGLCKGSDCEKMPPPIPGLGPFRGIGELAVLEWVSDPEHFVPVIVGSVITGNCDGCWRPLFVLAQTSQLWHCLTIFRAPAMSKGRRATSDTWVSGWVSSS